MNMPKEDFKEFVYSMNISSMCIFYNELKLKFSRVNRNGIVSTSLSKITRSLTYYQGHHQEFGSGAVTSSFNVAKCQNILDRKISLKIKQYGVFGEILAD